MRLTDCILALAAVPTGWAETVTVVQPETAGVELIGPQSSEFQTYLQAAISPEVVRQFSAWLPYAVVLRNNSSQPLVAYHIKWRLTLLGRADGNLRRRFWRRRIRTDTLNAEGAAVFIMAFNFTDAHLALNRLASIERQGASMLAALQLAKAPVVFIDSAIFASDNLLVPIRMGTLPTMQRRFPRGARLTRKFERSCKLAKHGTPSPQISHRSEIKPFRAAHGRPWIGTSRFGKPRRGIY